MVLAYIGIAIGVLIVAILIVKIAKTNPRDVAGIDVYCRKCGLETRGLNCPKCEKKSNSFGV
ncbi:membrane protein [Candidatus Nitrosopumilus sediminis]|uniref:Putative membrane protein n=1 Tax=Candidatus Nitrosopumilus sediminis TaxID=1229909 RepID=K0B975_9ARCH|nr:membrane protein [Candidatus Nitrosopumilus sediminis]AFS82024.1 putative membrane protein [Candidatus Nitrosopumilus sediminis]